MYENKVLHRVKDLSQQIDEARVNGDLKWAALLTRLKEQAILEVQGVESRESKEPVIKEGQGKKSVKFITSEQIRLSDRELDNWNKVKNNISNKNIVNSDKEEPAWKKRVTKHGVKLSELQLENWFKWREKESLKKKQPFIVSIQEFFLT